MIVVLDHPGACPAVLDALGDASARASVFLEAKPPLVAIPDVSPEHVAALARLPGVQRVFERDEPVLAGRLLREDTHVVRVGDRSFGGREVPVIAGPCSVESETHLLSLAERVQGAGASLLRGGAFKGRTSPYAFQGLGNDALPLLRRTQEKTGLGVVTEVLSVDDVDAIAEVADVLQVGARNMHNTALLKRLGRTKRPVLLKRGFGSHIDELLFAAEYILAEGNPDVILCERGIRTFERGVRFSFDLSAFALLKEKSRLPVVVDPSHAVGRASLVGSVAKAAIAAGADGLLIEVHDAPEHALSDGDQALTPGVFQSLMDELRAIAKAVGRHVEGGAA